MVLTFAQLNLSRPLMKVCLKRNGMGGMIFLRKQSYARVDVPKEFDITHLGFQYPT